MASDDSTPKITNIQLTQGYIATVDEDDGDLAQHQWYPAKKNGKVYVWRKSTGGSTANKTTIHLHRVIMERVLDRKLDSKEQVDHEDLNPLNNCRSNLRLATPAQNLANKPPLALSGYKGVGVRNGGEYFTATFNKKSLGCYRTIEEAGAVYNAAAFAHFGEFAYLNNIPNWEQLAEQAKSRTVRLRNTSGYTGVSKKRNKWEASFYTNQRKVQVGVFDTPELAAAAREKAIKEYHSGDKPTSDLG